MARVCRVLAEGRGELVERSTRIYLLHRYRLFAEALSESIAASRPRPPVELAGWSGSIESAISDLPTLEVDVLLLDRHLDTAPTFPNLARIREALPRLKLVLLGLEREEEVIDSIEAGAQGCLLCSATMADFLATIDQVVAGRPGWSPEVQSRLHERLVGLLRLDRRRHYDLPRDSRLTPREREVLRVLHLTNKEVGQELGIAEATVKIHVHKVLKKLRVRNRREAVRLGREMGLRD